MENSEDDEPTSKQFKVILLGDGAVGKTSIATRFTEERFAQSYKQTIGLDFFTKRVILPDGTNVTLQLWDIGGQSIGGKMITKYIFGAHAVLLCYDITNYQSFQNLEDWYRLVRQTFEGRAMPQVILVANKMDLMHLRTVKPGKHAQFVEENDTMSYLLSAKNGQNVSSAFFRVASVLAGVPLSHADLEASTTVVKAEIIDHPRHNDSTETGKRGKNCTVM